MPDLSIVIVNYNTCEPLRRCLQSIQAHHDNLDVEVIVVDNGSKDDSTVMVREVMPKALLIEPGRNTWFSGGNNIGFHKAGANYGLILNADTVFQAGTMATMLDYLRAHPEVGGVTCQMHFPNGTLQPTCSRAPGYTDLLMNYTFLGALIAPLRKRRRTYMFYGEWDRRSSRPVEIAPGSNILVRMPLIRQIGGFDERLKLYFTEDDLCRQILRAGYAVHFLAEAVLIHEERASVNQVSRLASQIYFDDMMGYSRKYFGDSRTRVLQMLIWPTRQAIDLAQRWRGEWKAV